MKGYSIDFMSSCIYDVLGEKKVKSLVCYFFYVNSHYSIMFCHNWRHYGLEMKNQM